MKIAFGMSRSLGAGLLVFFVAAPVFGQAYPNPPRELTKRIDATLADVRSLGGQWNKLVLFTVADALMSDQDMEIQRHMVEAARTDKQVGASASSSGSTTLAEKPGLAGLLALALEHGALTQEVNGTNLTLTLSPYVLFTRGQKEGEPHREVSEFWQRLNFSATFNMENEGSASVANINRNQLTEYSARFRILGDRSGDAKDFAEKWRQVVQPQIQRELDMLTDLLDELQSQAPQFFPQVEVTKTEVLTAVQQLVGPDVTTVQDARKQQVRDAILHALYTQIFVPVRDGTITIPPAVRDKIVAKLREREVLLQRQAEGRRQLDTLLEEVNKPSLLTFAYTNHRTSTASDYSELKLLFERQVAPLNVVANTGISFYNDPDPTKNQSNMRDWHATLSLEGESRNPFEFNRNDPSKVTYSLSGRYEKMKETQAEIAVAQFKIELPISFGVSLPFSLTYANRTELIDEKEVRGNFGISFDLDKLYALTRAVLKQ